MTARIRSSTATGPIPASLQPADRCLADRCDWDDLDLRGGEVVGGLSRRHVAVLEELTEWWEDISAEHGKP
jgi:hypothetical protein